MNTLMSDGLLMVTKELVSPKRAGARNTDHAPWRPRSMSENESDSTESSDATCPACGDRFTTAAGMKQHYTRYCDESDGSSLSGVEVSCSWCGDTKRVKPYRARDQDNHFCGTDCEGNWLAENRVGEDSPAWGGGGVNTECSNCGDSLTVMEARYKKRERHYCSNTCMAEHYSDRMSGSCNPNWDQSLRVKTSCAWCGDTIERPQSLVEDSDRAFCDLECCGEWRSENLVGESSPAWKGGHERYYGPSWRGQRKRALKRDGSECQVCGRTDTVHVHHITPFRKFGQANHKEANSLSNLVTLCPEHHGKWEGIPVAPQ